MHIFPRIKDDEVKMFVAKLVNILPRGLLALLSAFTGHSYEMNGESEQENLIAFTNLIKNYKSLNDIEKMLSVIEISVLSNYEITLIEIWVNAIKQPS